VYSKILPLLTNFIVWVPEVAGKYERRMVWALGRDLFSPSWLSTSKMFGKLQLVESVDTYAVSHYYGLMTRMDNICFHAALVDDC
jgi:hypothetical protein